jgi:hypothetical protein
MFSANSTNAKLKGRVRFNKNRDFDDIGNGKVNNKVTWSENRVKALSVRLPGLEPVELRIDLYGKIDILKVDNL